MYVGLVQSTLHRPLPVEQSSVIRAGVLLHAWVDGFARVVGVLVRVAESFGVVVLFFGFLQIRVHPLGLVNHRFGVGVTRVNVNRQHRVPPSFHHE